MQTIPMYVCAANTLGVVRDYANAQSASPPTFTKAVSVCLKMRLFAGTDNPDPYPLAELQSIPTWQFVMDDDFDEESKYILVADHADIKVNSVKETIAGVEYTYTEISIPISKMNTEELEEILGKQESIATLNGELVGFDSEAREVFVLQVKGFTVRNRISSTGNPTEILPEYLNEAQVRALCAKGLDMIFAATASETASDWHETQLSTDLYCRMRLNGDTRIWTQGKAADAGWSDPIGLLKGAKGDPGEDGKQPNIFVGFATDLLGSDFTLNPLEVTADHIYVGFLSTSKTSVTAEDFLGLWIRFFYRTAYDIEIEDEGDYFTGETVEEALQELGESLAGVEELLAEV